MSYSKTLIHPVNVTILTEILKAGDNFVSGMHLANTLDLSRVSIRTHLKKLQTEGFSFEATRNRGYRLLKQPSTIHPDLLNAYLQLRSIDIPLFYFHEIDSTNTEAERQLTNPEPTTPFVVVSNKQTQGRGRHGRSWYSEDSGNVYISLAFKPSISPLLIKSFTPWVAAQLCHTLNQEFNLPIKLKWPNDLIFKDKKICGMLAESRIDADHTRDLIFGIGLNINGSPPTWPKELQKVATSIESITGTPFNINQMSSSVISSILHSYELFIKNTWQPSFPSLWSQYDSLYDKKIKVFHGTTSVEGIAKGINQHGTLKLLLNTGKLLLLDIGEVSLSSPT